MKQVIALILLVVVSNIGLVVGGIAVSQDFTDAFDAAVQELIVDPEWKEYYLNATKYSVPTCSNAKVTWPVNDPFIGRTALKMCFEIGTISPWLETKTKLAESIVQKINKRYGSKYYANIIQIDTYTYGYFATMKDAVDNGECDMISSSTNVLAERTSLIHYQCPFGSTSYAWIRSSKDPNLVLTDINQLNQTGIIISAVGGTIYSSYISKNLKAATIISSRSLTDQYKLILDGSIHAAIGDGIGFKYWASNVTGGCNCTVQTIDNEITLYGTFTTLNITKNSPIVYKSNVNRVVNSTQTNNSHSPHSNVLILAVLSIISLVFICI